MNDILYIDPLTNRVTPAWLSTAVDELILKVRHKDIWEICDFCIEIWAKKFPQEHKAYLKEMKAYRSRRLNSFSSTKSNSLRELINIPREINFLLDKLASHRIADYGPKKFWREFAKRYKGFSPAEKV